MSYADDNTPYVCSENVGVTLEKLEEVGKVLFECFQTISLRQMLTICHLILSTDEPFSIFNDFIFNEVIKNSSNKKLLGINLSTRLGFDNRVGKKLHALVRISQFMNIHKRRMAMKAFIASDFRYCPLVWMFHSKKLNSQVKSIKNSVSRLCIFIY